ncbi:MAG TPA: low temperature requirement protein A [Marmoricola sp.]|nr:low temperature requirement protein A [Marmoricola sp.]
MSGTTRLTWPSAAWHPIFFDLSLVAVVLALSGALSSYSSVGMAVWLTFAFVAIWLSWAIVMFTEPIHPVGVRRVTVMAVQMGALLTAAVAADDTVSDNTRVLGIALAVAVWATLPLLRRSGSWTDSRAAGRVALAGLMWVASALLWSTWWVLVPWLLALALMGNGVRRLAAGEPDPHRIAHRLGELTIVVIGEGFLKVALVGSSIVLTLTSALAAVLALVLATLVWWGYFILPRAGGTWTTRGMAGHFGLHLGLIGLAVGLAKLLAYDVDLPDAYGSGLIALPIGLVALGLAMIAFDRGSRSTGAAYLVMAAAGGGAAVALWAGWLGPRVTTTGLTALLGIVVLREAVRPNPDGP